MSTRILDTISCPADLRKLDNSQLEDLASEIRREIIAVTSQTGGHVASSLGAVETILAVHSLIDAPRDRFVFDVGHQSYAHKLITGRRDAFPTLRTYGGISGFPKPNESAYDVHTSGHASDSLSIALGLAMARDLRGGSEKVVALIGDASIAGGMAQEALNHIGQARTQLVVILNDNEMSISHNVGALMRHFGAVRASREYQMRRDSLQEAMEKMSGLSRTLLWLGKNAKDSAKQFFIPHAMIYEQLGIVCTAPIDGHDIGLLRDVISVALEAQGPVLVHVVTRKGEGYPPAMENPELFHGIGPYDPATGVPKGSAPAPVPATAPAPAPQVPAPGSPLAPAPGSVPPAPAASSAASAPAEKPLSYSKAFGLALEREMERDDAIVAMTAAMTGGTGMSAIAKRFPDRFVDTGITEGHLVGMAAGIAIEGGKPVVAVYSTFLQRAIDQMIVDVALMNLNVVFAIDRGGIVGADGPTHHGAFDLVYTRMIPGMRVIAPSDEVELAAALHTALALEGPVAVRYPRGSGIGSTLPLVPELMEPGRARILRGDGMQGTPGTPVAPDVAFLAFGEMVKTALAAADLLEREGVRTRVADMRWVKPIDADEVARAAKARLIVTLEDGALAGGAGSAVLEVLAEQGRSVPVLRLGIPDSFAGAGKTELIMADLGLDAASVARSAAERLARA